MTITQYSKSEKGTLLAFKDDDDGVRYHIRKHREPVNFFKAAASGIAGGAAGGRIAALAGPVGILVGVAVGSVIGIAGDKALEHANSHLQKDVQTKLVYVNEYGNELYEAPVSI